MAVILGLAGGAAAAILPASAGDIRYWADIDAKLGQLGSWRVAVAAKAYLAETPYDFNAWEINPKFNSRVRPWLDTGVNFTHYESRSAATGVWSRQDRIEFDLVPEFALGSAKLQVLNRCELIMKEGQGGRIFPRYRLHPKLTVSAHWLPAMESFGVANEAYYDFRAEAWTENRCYPVKLTFGVGQADVLTFYYMFNSKRPSGAAPWVHSHVFGVSWALALRP